MKEKIKEALRQEYKSRLELDDERLDGVAAFASTFIADEAKIEEFVKNEATLAMLKSYQSVVDKDRAKRNKQNPAPKPKPSEESEQETEAEKKEQPDIKAMLAEALAEVVNPLKEELTKFKTEQTAKAAFEEAKAQFFGNDYVKKYSDEATDAWEVAMAIRDYNPEWSAEEITKCAMDRFNKTVAKKGMDTTKPLESDADGGEEPDFSGEIELLKGAGVKFAE